MPLIGDFHFNGHKLLQEHPACAEALAKYRINPGNVGRGSKRDSQFAEMIEIACRNDKPVRIGVNWGSLDQDLLVRLMDENSRARRAAIGAGGHARGHRALGPRQRASARSSSACRATGSCCRPRSARVQDLIAVYSELAARSDFPLHLGLTEAGMGSKGIVASSAAMAILLQQGIGDTIRVSLTPEPGGDRTREVIVAQELLQTMGLRSFTPLVTACPGCGRTTSTYFQDAGRSHPAPPARAHAGVAQQLSRRREHDRGGHGLRGQRARARASTPISASACPAPASARWRRSTRTAPRP